jgi:hypothetical protein
MFRDGRNGDVRLPYNHFLYGHPGIAGLQANMDFRVGGSKNIQECCRPEFRLRFQPGTSPGRVESPWNSSCRGRQFCPYLFSKRRQSGASGCGMRKRL